MSDINSEDSDINLERSDMNSECSDMILYVKYDIMQTCPNWYRMSNIILEWTHIVLTYCHVWHPIYPTAFSDVYILIIVGGMLI